MTGPAAGEVLWIIDGNNLAHRLFHALPIDEVRGADGEPINVLIGWVQTIRRLRANNQVNFLLPVFDGDGDGWRHELYPEYKAARPSHPPELQFQWSLLFELTEAMGMPSVRVDGVEADDMIASYTEAAVARGLDVVIISNDKDLLQLVRGELGEPMVRAARRVPRKLELLGPTEVEEMFGVAPELLGDLLALAGDRDEAPGVDGIGPRTAAKILRSHGSLEQAIDRWSLITGKASTRLRDQADRARLSRKLVDLQRDLELPIPLDDLRPWNTAAAPVRRTGLDRLFHRLGFVRFEAAVDAYTGRA